MADELHPDVRDARRAVADLTRERAVLLGGGDLGLVDVGRLGRLDDQIAERLNRVAGLVDPCDASPDVPLVLLPVRLETRLADTPAGVVLKVRIYPDEIHVDDLVRGLTDSEVAAGRAYWTAVWAEPIDPGAFGRLVEAVSAKRAEWVAHVCTPGNLAARPAVPPDFPEVGPAATRNVVARSLPDRFVVRVTQGGAVHTAVGGIVPRDLMLSPIPLDGDDAPRGAGQLRVPVGAEWLVDFDAAVKVGMGVVVPLPGRAPISQVLALGTRASQTADAGATDLEALLEGHRFSGGLSLLAQGVASNNSDQERSPYRSRPTPVAPPLDPLPADPASDAAAAAAVLGVDPGRVSGLVGPGTGEQAVSRATNTALWAPGWGAYLLELDEHDVPGVVDAQRESARQLFRDHVRARGPAPALRVGAQPYGVLPVSDLRRWQPATGETTAGILHVVRLLLDRWLIAAQRRVDRIRPGAPGVDDTMLDILGAAPVAQGLRVRPVLSDDITDALIAALGLSRTAYQSEQWVSAGVFSYLLPTAARKLMTGSLNDVTRPLPLPFASDRDPEFIAALLGSPSRTLAVDSVLQALAVLALDISERDVIKSAPATVLPALIGATTLNPELKAKAVALLARADSASADDFHALAGEITATGVEAGGPSLLAKFQPVVNIQTSLAEVALAAPAGAELPRLASAALAGWLLQMGYTGEVKDALAALAQTTTPARSLAVAEALDCSSHRLDAWATAIVTQRRARQKTRRGLTLGAYGVVQELREEPPGTDGWLHAPSTRHATAAGLLRSAHLSHLPEGDGGGAFAIDLSSQRLRRATAVIDGVRQGQQLAALIGYEIERGLAKARLARLQLSLRSIAPLVARRLHAADGGADDAAAQEAVAATNVVDGLLLLRRHPPGDPALRTRLNQSPNNAYVVPGTWQPLTDGEWATVTAVLRAAAETVDAVADTMLSESVLQYVNGNPSRAAAAMDAMGSGAAPADALDVLETHESGERLTHRVLAVVGNAAASAWNAARPRALAEPGLEKWASARLGDPATVVVADVGGNLVTLDAAGLAALDLVHTADLIELERHLRRVLPELAGAELSVSRDGGWPTGHRALGQVAALASTLRATIVGGTPLTASDLARPKEVARSGVAGQSAANPMAANDLTHSAEAEQRPAAASRSDLVARMTSAAALLSATVAGLQVVVAALPAEGIVASEPDAEPVRVAIEQLADYGVPLTPDAARPLDLAWARSAWQAARARALSATELAGALAALPLDASIQVVLDAAQNVADTVFGDGFTIVPLLPKANGPDDFAQSWSEPAFAQPSATTVRRLLRDFGTVRDQVRRLNEVLLLGGALGVRQPLRVAQLSEVSAAGAAPGTDRWLAGPLPETGPWPAAPVTHLIVDPVGIADPGDQLCGLVVDAWVEDLPAQVGPKADPDDPQPGSAVTGLAVRANSASARAPQAILSAISPDGKRWTADAIAAVVEQTLDLARVRLVRLDQLLGEGRALPALYVRSSSLQGEPAWHFQDLKLASTMHVSLPYVKEVL